MILFLYSMFCALIHMCIDHKHFGPACFYSITPLYLSLFSYNLGDDDVLKYYLVTKAGGISELSSLSFC